MSVRRFQRGDEPDLFNVFYSAVHLAASRDYTPEQIEAWAPADLDQELWAKKMRDIQPFVAEIDGRIVGYADVQPSGYIDHFFVSGYHQGQGIGRLLMSTLLEEAARRGLTELSADVSRTAQPFFEHVGFHLVEERKPVVRGVVVPNARMRKELW